MPGIRGLIIMIGVSGCLTVSTFAQHTTPVFKELAGETGANSELKLPSMSSPINFTEVFVYDLGSYWCENRIAVGDYDNDSDLDILLHITRGGGGYVRLLLNDGSYNFDPTNAASHSGYGYDISSADFNLDGYPDFAVRMGGANSHGSKVYLNNGDATFYLHSVVAEDYGYGGTACEDIDLDGDIDLLLGFQSGSGGVLKTYLNDGAANFSHIWTSPSYGTGNGVIYKITSARINQDDYPDIVATEIYSGTGLVFQNDGSEAGFSEVWNHGFGTRLFGLSIINFNDDSVDDAVFTVGWGNGRLYKSNSAMLVSEWQSENHGEASFNVGSGDFDGDGYEDIFVGNFGNGALYIYRNIVGQSMELTWADALDAEGYSGTVIDINKDGYSDLIVGEENVIRIWLNDGNTEELAIIQPDTMKILYAYAVNPMSGSIYLGNLQGGHTPSDIDPSSVLINGRIPPTSISVVSSHPDIPGETAEIVFPLSDFILDYGLLWDTTTWAYTVSGQYEDGVYFSAEGEVVFIGHASGDANNDETVNVGDAVYLINYIFNSGATLFAAETGDANCDGQVDVGDVVYIINYVFRGGEEPCHL
jgi:hypothetical protein